MVRLALCLIGVFAVHPGVVAAQSCTLSYRILVTQGIPPLPEGAEFAGSAAFRLTGERFAQGGGATTHRITGEMRLGPDITGDLWALGTASGAGRVDMVALYARDVTGLSHGGVTYAGPMMITLYGPPGSRPDMGPPLAQSDWNAMTGPRRFALHAYGHGRVAGDVTALTLGCGPGPGD